MDRDGLKSSRISPLAIGVLQSSKEVVRTLLEHSATLVWPSFSDGITILDDPFIYEKTRKRLEAAKLIPGTRRKSQDCGQLLTLSQPELAQPG